MFLASNVSPVLLFHLIIISCHLPVLYSLSFPVIYPAPFASITLAALPAARLTAKGLSTVIT
jgi:hypothetical protein